MTTTNATLGERIVDGLITAFGGYSAVPTEVIGQALASAYYNGHRHSEVLEAVACIAVMYGERYEETAAETAAFATKLMGAFEAATEALNGRRLMASMQDSAARVGR